jgi:hypothetical protein
MLDPEAVQPLSGGAAAVLLHWSYLRRSALIGRALAERFPTEEAWQSWFEDQAARDMVEEFAALMDELREIAVLEGPEHADQLDYDRARSCLTTLAEQLGVTPDDLLNVSVYA